MENFSPSKTLQYKEYKAPSSQKMKEALKKRNPLNKRANLPLPLQKGEDHKNCHLQKPKPSLSQGNNILEIFWRHFNLLRWKWSKEQHPEKVLDPYKS